MKMYATRLMLAFVLVGLTLRAQTPVQTGDKVAAASGITINVASARAVLTAITNPQLTRTEALRIAGLGGNQGLIQKENSQGRPAKTADLADALLAAAQDKPASEAFNFSFAAVKAKAPALIALLDRIEAHPVDFSDWVIQRVAAFSPANGHTAITGYLVAGGSNGGFAFDEPAFYLNLNYFPDFETAKVVMAHELYHAVQGIYADKTKPWYAQAAASTGPGATQAMQCSSTSDLFDALYEEGSASYVGDELLLEGVDTPEAKKELAEMRDGLSQLHRHATLLELSVVGLDAQRPVAFDDIYSLGFYVPAPLYNLGYVMAKAIDKDAGRAALIAQLVVPGYRFADAYVQLPNYGKDRDHPKLGANTVAAIRRLTAGCPRSAGTVSKN